MFGKNRRLMGLFVHITTEAQNKRYLCRGTHKSNMMIKEQISVFDMFKIGIGPSSSHTLGPWRAAQRFTRRLADGNLLEKTEAVKILLYGSLAKTGIGHGTDVAVLLGMSGADPVTIAIDEVPKQVAHIKQQQSLLLGGTHPVTFRYTDDLLFLYTESLPFHPNAVTFQALLNDGTAVSETYYSIGGGFVVQEGDGGESHEQLDLAFPIQTANDLLVWCVNTGLKVSELVLENEQAWRSEVETTAGIRQLFTTIRDCI